MGILRLLDQWTSKTLGGGTQLSVDDYHRIQDPVHIQQGNLDAVNLTNAVGRAANVQSSSGPIVNTQFVSQTSATASGDHVLFTPEEGTVYQLAAASVGTLSSGTTKVQLLLNDTDTTYSTLLEAVTAAAAAFDLGEPIYVGYPCRLVGNLTGYSSGTTTIRISCVRVR